MSTETALAYASVILADSDIEITTENLIKLTQGANIEFESIWASIFAKALEGKDLQSLLVNFNVSAGPAAAGASSGAAAGSSEEAAEEEVEEAKEESDDDMGFGLFD
ncbi:ribosomal protein P1A [Pichia kluyveri]|uniref:Ribosomal protein P1A n=1 Tax=Pichia kluyveri TaxID=36015 RepID=A0AAV5RCA0_PICKL|nr:ribosomal protein P1A [Pichia kluyveri]